MKACLLSFFRCLPAYSISSEQLVLFLLMFSLFACFSFPVLPFCTLGLSLFCFVFYAPIYFILPLVTISCHIVLVFLLPHLRALLLRASKTKCRVRSASSLQTTVFWFPWSSQWASGLCIALCKSKARTGGGKVECEGISTSGVLPKRQRGMEAGLHFVKSKYFCRLSLSL